MADRDPAMLAAQWQACVEYSALDRLPGCTLPLHVVGLQAGEEVRIAGLTLRSQALGGFVASAFVVENCVVGRFMRMQFPSPKGGGIVIVSYPFIFSAG